MKRLGLMLLALGACSPQDEAQDAPRHAEERVVRARNVVLLSIDTLRADHLEAYGYARPTSPFLAELAARGTLFEQAYSQAPWTLPSHGAMLMSRHPSSLGEGPWERPRRLPDEAHSIAEVLRDAGVRTRAIVNKGFVSAVFGLDQGFEHYGEHDKPLELTVRRAGRWLDTLESDERFFLFLHTYEVHEYQPPAEVAAEFVGPYDGFLDELGEKLPMFVQDRALGRDMPELDEVDLAHLIDLYDATIREADDAVRDLWAMLEQRGLADDTLLVITSDHGEEFLEHGGTGHGYTLHDENLRVPLILVHPSLPARRVAEQVRLIDLAPTIAELAGLDAPSDWEGLSLTALLEGDTTPRPAFAEQAHRPFASVRTGDLKYILGEHDAVELYDLASDPHETTNLAGEHPAEQDLRSKLGAWITAHNAWPPPLPSEAAELAPELLDDLKRLGYLGEAPGDE